MKEQRIINRNNENVVLPKSLKVGVAVGIDRNFVLTMQFDDVLTIILDPESSVNLIEGLLNSLALLDNPAEKRRMLYEMQNVIRKDH